MMLKLKKTANLLRVLCKELTSPCYVVKMSAYFDSDGNLNKENWGDDINYWFYKEIVDAKIISYDLSILSRFFNRPYVLGIGSLLTLFPIDHAIVWGSGVMSNDAKIVGKPKEVRAVRGPLSRMRLLDAGIDCPEVYGDPALLLPLYYTPKVEKKYRIGIIPHYNDINSPFLESIKDIDDVHVIRIRDYEHWLDFVDQINQCEIIASSSLHGLIVSEAYSIPNVWIKFNDSPTDDIKFHDFFLSMNNDREPLVLKEPIDLKKIEDVSKSYKKGDIDFKKILDTCPFKLKEGVGIDRKRMV
jgi:pyruvyltransferase